MDSLKSSPCTLVEICRLHDLTDSDAIKYCKILEHDGLITRRIEGGKLCFLGSKSRGRG